MKMLELSDALSMFGNKGQTRTETVLRTGEISNSGITLEYLDEDSETILVTCAMDGNKSHLLLTREPRLPFEVNRTSLVGTEFALFRADDKLFAGEFNDDDNETRYLIQNSFTDSYSESPKRALLDSYGLQMTFVMYAPHEGKTENVDYIIAMEIGNNLTKFNPGLVYFFNARLIDTDFVSYLE